MFIVIGENKCNSIKGNFEKGKQIPYDPAIPLPHVYIFPKELKAGPWTVISTPMFIGAWFTIAKRWVQPKCPLVGWINKMWYTHIMEYYWALKWKETDTCYNMGEPWKHAKWNKPNTKEQISFHLYEASRVVRLIETENWIVVARGWREGEMGIII